jgi:hypothetical protein
MLADGVHNTVTTWTTDLLVRELGAFNVIDPCILFKNSVKMQPAHRDLRDDSHHWRENVPVAGIIALQDNTTILVRRDALQCDKGRGLERVHLNAGDVLIMHGLCVHAGDEYTRRNTRLHFVGLSDRLRSRPINETFVVMYD